MCASLLPPFRVAVLDLDPVALRIPLNDRVEVVRQVGLLGATFAATVASLPATVGLVSLVTDGPDVADAVKATIEPTLRRCFPLCVRLGAAAGGGGTAHVLAVEGDSASPRLRYTIDAKALALHSVLW